jgi:hypothetical protein
MDGTRPSREQSIAKRNDLAHLPAHSSSGDLMDYSPILAPVVALVAWSLVMQVWMYVSRFTAMKRAGISLQGRVGTRGNALEGAIPDQANWKAHNYAHLMEQPTLFYAIALVLVLMGFDWPINVYLAWGYVGLRIVHSIVQSPVNVVRIRFLIFLLSTLCLVGLTTHAAIFLIRHG